MSAWGLLGAVVLVFALVMRRLTRRAERTGSEDWQGEGNQRPIWRVK